MCKILVVHKNPWFNPTYVLESSRIFVDHQLNIRSTIPKDWAISISAVVSEAREDDDALGQQP